ncbi:hypothetical protein EAG_05310 [Camponotus floridanus]|uniref:Uncharacterized protein n=1 Tax=Camponotus floridanus TaxID=104421 RepID=E2A051_CAMFO|nr:hypothetical protein EAG_05310 [Camponotus floridanus]
MVDAVPLTKRTVLIQRGKNVGNKHIQCEKATKSITEIRMTRLCRDGALDAGSLRWISRHLKNFRYFLFATIKMNNSFSNKKATSAIPAFYEVFIVMCERDRITFGSRKRIDAIGKIDHGSPGRSKTFRFPTLSDVSPPIQRIFVFGVRKLACSFVSDMGVVYLVVPTHTKCIIACNKYSSFSKKVKIVRNMLQIACGITIMVVGILHSKRFLATGGIESWMGLGYLLRYLRAITSTCPSVDFRHVNSPTLRLASCEGEPVRSRNEPAILIGDSVISYLGYSIFILCRDRTCSRELLVFKSPHACITVDIRVEETTWSFEICGCYGRVDIKNDYHICQF